MKRNIYLILECVLFCSNIITIKCNDVKHEITRAYNKRGGYDDLMFNYKSISPVLLF